MVFKEKQKEKGGKEGGREENSELDHEDFLQDKVEDRQLPSDPVLSMDCWSGAEFSIFCPLPGSE